MQLKRYQKLVLAVVFITIVIEVFFTIRKLIFPEEQDMSIIWSILFTTLVSISIILVNHPIYEKVKLQFPIRIDLFTRITLVFLITTVFAAIIISIWVIIFYFVFKDFGTNQGIVKIGLMALIFDNIVIAVIVNFVFGSIMILRYSIIGWKQTFIEAEQYKRKSIETQYSALVNQINPHFLFNSMNALSSLIPESPEKAVEFVNSFSKIYRYVLDVKDKIVSELKDEIEFLDSYCFLQKIRFGDNLIIEKQIDASCMNCFLPPLCLQLLVENAIKHNEISKSHPLKVTIESNKQFIVVKNNLQLKFNKEESSGIGLKNLKERYNHLTELVPEFYLKNNEYIAKVPLIFEE